MASEGREHVTGEVAAPQQDRLEALRDLIPEAFGDGDLSLEALCQALGVTASDSSERYSFGWAGKREAIRLLQVPSRATLVPDMEESVDFDQSPNAFIEGDNLEVLKLLHKAYASRIKMIYIDPPYNTGKEFIYPDNFRDPLDAYMRLTSQKDAEGNLATSNPETGGRFHSAWLSMMYPRLFIARQLLSDDGIIFVSIDDNEFHNVRLLMNELFGEENFVGVFVRKRRMSSGMSSLPVSTDHEYVVAYARAMGSVRLNGLAPKPDDYPLDDVGGRFRSSDLTIGMDKTMRPNQFYPIKNPRTGAEYLPPDERVWRFQPSTMDEQIAVDNIIWPDDQPASRMSRPRFKTRLESAQRGAVIAVSTWIPASVRDSESGELVAGMNQEGTKELRALLGTQTLEYPKPVSLIRALVELATSEGDLVLDFFAGSGTTAQAAIEAGGEDRATRRFMLVQLPEPVAPSSAAGQAGYATVSELSRERVRRALKTLPHNPGFRAFRLSESNIRPWSGVSHDSSEELVETMQLFSDPLVDGWEALDVVYEVALKEGYSLSCDVSSSEVGGNMVYTVSDAEIDQSFRICLDGEISQGLGREMDLVRGDLFVCRDVALSDTVAANLALQCRLKTI